jgi:hypothetical protein
MTIHILDIVMYFVVIGVFWFLLDWLSDGEYTNELGGLVGLFLSIIITIIYVILFAFCGWDWAEIFRGTNPSEWFHFKL